MTARIPLTVPDPERDHFQGSADAPIKLLEYGDYECPFSRRAFREIERVEGQLNGGIRFSFRGRVWDLIKIFILGSFLTGLTLGLYYPIFLVSRQAFMVSHAYFGSEKFDFTGRGRDLFGPFVVALLLTLPTLGLCWIWYVAFKRRYFWDHTTFGGARFVCRVTGRALLGLWVVNLLLLVGTLGIAWPWVRVRNIHFAFRNLALVGTLDLARIQQQAQQAGSVGEGLSGFFDSGFDLA